MKMSNPKPIYMRQFMTILAAFVCVAAMAQKKPNITKAKAMLDKGEYAEAKAMIDQATTYEKTMGKAKTWYYRGQIYTALDTALNEPGALETAIESYNKALEIDPGQKSISEFIPNKIQEGRVWGVWVLEKNPEIKEGEGAFISHPRGL